MNGGGMSLRNGGERGKEKKTSRPCTPHLAQALGDDSFVEQKQIIFLILISKPIRMQTWHCFATPTSPFTAVSYERPWTESSRKQSN